MRVNQLRSRTRGGCELRWWISLVLVVMLLGGGIALNGQEGKSDEQLATEIRGRFTRSRIAKNGFRVAVRNGIATLSGETPIVQHKGTATRLARLAGAREVINEIVVTRKAPRKSPSAETPDRQAVAPSALRETAIATARPVAPEDRASSSAESAVGIEEGPGETEVAAIPKLRVIETAAEAKHKRAKRRY